MGTQTGGKKKTKKTKRSEEASLIKQSSEKGCEIGSFQGKRFPRGGKRRRKRRGRRGWREKQVNTFTSKGKRAKQRETKGKKRN